MNERIQGIFDPRISYGTIIQVLLILAAVGVAWLDLDKRVVVLEESRNTQLVRDKHQDFLINQQSTQIEKTALEIKQSILRIEQKLDDINKATR